MLGPIVLVHIQHLAGVVVLYGEHVISNFKKLVQFMHMALWHVQLLLGEHDVIIAPTVCQSRKKAVLPQPLGVV
tara:strand:+ start:225 stop:446 length:222 start_codon:yes stop_codon:yes gene_type:complete